MSNKFYLVDYDIPEGRGLRNPSWFLRRAGARISGSCWVIRESRIPYRLLNALEEGGSIWHANPFDDEGAEGLAKMALSCLSREVDRFLRRAELAEARARGLAGMAGDVSAATDPDGYERRIERITRRAARTLEDLQAGAEALGIVLDVNAGLTRVRAIQSAANARALQYARMVEAARAAGLKGAAALAEADAVPGTILADMIEEGGEAVPDGAREAFQGTAI
jgi:hypothetical protein